MSTWHFGALDDERDGDLEQDFMNGLQEPEGGRDFWDEYVEYERSAAEPVTEREGEKVRREADVNKGLRLHMQTRQRNTHLHPITPTLSLSRTTTDANWIGSKGSAASWSFQYRFHTSSVNNQKKSSASTVQDSILQNSRRRPPTTPTNLSRSKIAIPRTRSKPTTWRLLVGANERA